MIQPTEVVHEIPGLLEEGLETRCPHPATSP
jgi:hypothetical protein